MGFTCLRCGECCHHMGMVHEIKEQVGDDEYTVRNRYTGQLTSVKVDQDKIHLFYNDLTRQLLPEACPFFRLDTTSKESFCTVHLTRPEICRDFGCWRFLVRDGSGTPVGRIFPPRMLVSTDQDLKEIWETRIREIHCTDDESWDTQMARILTSAGYRVVK